jgi:hypothetical protein
MQQVLAREIIIERLWTALLEVYTLPCRLPCTSGLVLPLPLTWDPSEYTLVKVYGRDPNTLRDIALDRQTVSAPYFHRNRDILLPP